MATASSDRQAEEAEARSAAKQQQNREAAAAFFEKTREAVELEDLPTALRRIRRAVELHPINRGKSRGSSSGGGGSSSGGGGSSRVEEETARIYLEWQTALEDAVAKQRHRSRADTTTSSANGTARNRDHDSAASSPQKRGREAKARREAEMAEAERLRSDKAERAQRKREAEEARARLQREKEDEAQRARARAKANSEAAEACIKRAAEVDEPESAVRLLRRAVALRRWSLQGRVLLSQALLWQQRCACSKAIADWYVARGGIRSYPCGDDQCHGDGVRALLLLAAAQLVTRSQSLHQRFRRQRRPVCGSRRRLDRCWHEGGRSRHPLCTRSAACRAIAERTHGAFPCRFGGIGSGSLWQRGRW